MSSGLSNLADGLIGSEILKIAAEVREMAAQELPLCDLTVGDFSPREFPIPDRLSQALIRHVREGQTNYAPSTGMPELRRAVVSYYRKWLGLDIPLECVIITAGGRPVIYGTYQTIVNSGDRVVYPVPSWNNTYYSYISGANAVELRCGPETNFFPTAAMLAQAVRGATLLVLNSPSNPTGTLMDERQLADICDLVLEENGRRGGSERPLYLLYDQIYWMLTFDAPHVNPVSLRPEMSRYTIFVDGISKSFAATGLRVGWGIGPAHVMRAMTDLLAHIGAGAPRPEQLASAELLCADDEMRSYRSKITAAAESRLRLLAEGIDALKQEGYPVHTSPPGGAIYLSARFALHGKRTPSGEILADNEAIRRYLLDKAGLAAVPFRAFGDHAETGWFRLSVGAVSLEQIRELLPRLRAALRELD